MRVHSLPAPKDLREAWRPWRNTFKPWGGTLPPYRPYVSIKFEDQVRVLLDAKVPAFSFIYGIPPKEILDECRAGIRSAVRRRVRTGLGCPAQLRPRIGFSFRAYERRCAARSGDADLGDPYTPHSADKALKQTSSARDSGAGRERCSLPIVVPVGAPPGDLHRIARLGLYSDIPPDTSMRCPFTQRLSSESSAAIIGPISSGTPARPNAVISATRLLISGLSRTMPPLKSVWIAPGATTLAVIPRGPSSLAR